MRFTTPLIPATLLRRYKRFLADIRLDDGTEVTAHCANPGAMVGVRDEGARIWVEPNDDPKRKLRYSWKLIELPGGHMAGIDTSVPNRVVKEALQAHRVVELLPYDTVTPEQKYGRNSRIDFLLRTEGAPDTYVEVKNVHMRRTDDWAEFPDSITARGAKHLGELSAMVAAGHRAVMLYLVQRTDCARLRIAPDMDAAYARAFDAAVAAGVEMLCYDTDITRDGIHLRRALPVATDLPTLEKTR
ncbi:MAG: DNA/RNA nuclease SfsA [Pseudomonadota bacterium]